MSINLKKYGYADIIKIYREGEADMKDFILSKKGSIVTAVSAVFTLIICAVMNTVLIPAIEEGTKGIRCFDMNFAYSFETAKLFLSLLSEKGRDLYLNVQLPLDFVYPIVYTVFFVFIITKLTRQVSVLSFLPLVLMFMDYTENICAIVMLKSEKLSESLVLIASIASSVKTTIMYLIFCIIIVSFIYWILQRKRKN